MLRSLLAFALSAAPLAAAAAPPRREPAYRHAPGYLLLKLGPAATPVWVSFDGERMHFDRNADGDLTNDGEPVAAPAWAADRAAVSYGDDSFEKTPAGGRVSILVPNAAASAGGAGRECSVEATFPPAAEGESALVFQAGSLTRRWPETPAPLRFAATPAAAPVVRAGGPLELRFRGAAPTLYAGGAVDFPVDVGCAGVGAFAAVQILPREAEVALTVTPRAPGAPPFRDVSGLSIGCRLMLPADAPAGRATLRVELTGWPSVRVAPLEAEVDVRPMPPAPPDPPTPPAAAFPRDGGAAEEVVRFTPDGGRVVAVARDGCRVVDVAAGTVTRDRWPEADAVPAFSPDGKWLAWVRDRADGISVRRWDVAARRELPPLPMRPDARLTGHRPRWSADGRYLLGSARLGEASPNVALELATGAFVRLEPWGKSGSRDVAPAADAGAAFLLHERGERDEIVRVAYPPAREERRAAAPGVHWFGPNAVSPDGSRLALLQGMERRDRRILLFDARTLGRVAELDAPPGVFDEQIAFSGDGKRLLALGDDGALRVWDAAAGGAPRVVPLGAPALPYPWWPRLTTSPDGRRAAVAWHPGRRDGWPTGLIPEHPVCGRVAAVDLANPSAPVRTIAVPGELFTAPAVAFRPDGAKLAVATSAGVFLYDAATPGAP